MRTLYTKLWAGAFISLSACVRTDPEIPSEPYLDTLPKFVKTRIGTTEIGKGIFIDRNKGHCVLCHSVSGLKVEFQGNVGPDLSDVGSRLNPAQIRLRIVDYDRIKSGVLMPSYYRKTGLNQLSMDRRGQTLLSAQDIEDLVVYLGTLNRTQSLEAE